MRLRSASASPQLFKRMIDEADPRAKPGDIVAVFDRNGACYGIAFYNPKSLITLRMLTRDGPAFDADKFFGGCLERAVRFRRETLGLEAFTDAYRLVHDLGDGLPGIVIDRYGDTLVLEFYALGMYRQAARLEKLLRVHYPNAKFVHRASQHTQTMEGLFLEDARGRRDRTEAAVPKSFIRENGIVFEISPTGGFKTGFFCDQRENRAAVGALAAGRRVLDLCSYTGGFGLYAAKGGAAEVTCVELDEDASAMGQRNANLNQFHKLKMVCADAFAYLRQMADNKERYGLLILDPYKFIASKDGYDEGRHKYIDLNRLALSVMEPGGILVTCSCSGMVSFEDFQQFVRTAAGSSGRKVQFFRKSGAGPDHPVAAERPEGEYLKVLWCRVF